MTWRIESVDKNCIHERREFAGDHEVAMIIVWRSGYFVVDEEPDLSGYDSAEGIEISSFNDWRFSDGSTELEFSDVTQADDREKIKRAFAEDGEDGLEALGYESFDTTYLLLGELAVTDLLPEIVEKIKTEISNMEDFDDLNSVFTKIEIESSIPDGVRTNLHNEALRSGLDYGADLFNFEDFCGLISNSTNDSALKLEALQQIRRNANDAHDLANAAKEIVKQLGDLSFACECIDEGLERSESNFERIRLVQVALEFLQDFDRAKKALIGFEEEADSHDCLKVAEAIAEHTEDGKWGAQWYAKSLELVTDWEDQYRLIGSIDIYSDEPDMARGAYDRYDYLKAVGLSPEHSYWDCDGADHLILLSPKGLATSNRSGVNISEESTLNEAWIWENGGTTLAFLLPGRYSGSISANVYQLSVTGLGDPQDVVISSNSGNTISLESGQLHLDNLTVVREDSEDAENSAAILVAGEVSLRVRDCILTSPGGFAFAAVGEETPLTEIIDCRVVDSANGIYGGAGRTSIDNVSYQDVSGFEARAGGKGLLEVIEDRHRALATLVENDLFFNLYEFDSEWVDPDDVESYGSDKGADIFKRVYYACALKQDMSEDLRSFFAIHLPDDFYKRMFPSAPGFHAFLGIYNVRVNKLFAIGLGRKDRVFKEASEHDLDWDEFCALDHAKIAGALFDRVEMVGCLHHDYLSSGDKAEEDELRDEMNEEWQILRNAVPTLPEDVSEVSGVSDHIGRSEPA
jgi:hypothetical protein